MNADKLTTPGAGGKSSENAGTSPLPYEAEGSVGTSTIVRIVVLICLVAVLVVSIVVLICFCRKRRKAKKLTEMSAEPNVRETKTLSEKVRPNAGMPLKVRRHARKPPNRNRKSVGAPQMLRTTADVPSQKKKDLISDKKKLSAPSPVTRTLPVNKPELLGTPLTKGSPPLPQIEESQPVDHVKPKPTKSVEKHVERSETSIATTGDVATVVEKQYACYENGIWRVVEQVESQFSFHLGSDHTFSEH